VVQVDERLRESPADHHRRRQLRVDDLRDELERRARSGGEGGSDPVELPLHRTAVGVGERRCVAHRAPVTRQDELHLETIDHVEAGQELARRIRRVAVVVVERHAAQEMVA
jgi:hypothetical protein